MSAVVAGDVMTLVMGVTGVPAVATGCMAFPRAAPVGCALYANSAEFVRAAGILATATYGGSP